MTKMSHVDYFSKNDVTWFRISNCAYTSVKPFISAKCLLFSGVHYIEISWRNSSGFCIYKSNWASLSFNASFILCQAGISKRCFDLKHCFVFNKLVMFCFERNSEYFYDLIPSFPRPLMFQLLFGWLF